jgi:hypothetical protein
MPSTRHRTRVLVGGAISALALTSCAGTQDAPARSAAQDFLAAVQAKDGQAACTLLAPAARAELESSSGMPCREAVLEEPLGGSSTPSSVDVFDSMAQVRFDSETLFLSRFDGDWLVIGAACTAKPGDQPYDCSIQVS